PQFNSDFTNRGSGYARGLDVFWRDGKSIKNLEYWVSYSFIDSQRNYRNFPTTVTPNFIAKHSISLVGKYWINDWKSQLSVTQVLSSGRPYNNPNESLFMNGRTKPFSNLSLSWAYLISSQKILYFSVNNILGTQNVLGYEYANTPDANGVFNRRIIEPTADRFFFVGFFWTLSDNKKDNQLNNL
ncbi:MAG: TonB-dependent receptor, partial [Flavobacterium sp.]